MKFHSIAKSKKEQYVWFNVRVRPGLDSRLDIREPPLEPTGILDRVFVGVRNADDK